MNNSNPEFSDKIFSWRDGRHWFDVGIALFKQVKNYWYLGCLLLGVLIALISNIAMGLVPVVVIFASPLVTAFIMNACDKATNNQTLGFASLWQEIIINLNAFMLLGVLSALFSVVAHYVHIQLLQLFNLPIELTQEMVSIITGREVMLRAVLNIVTNLPIALALAFSPALILFKRTKPLKAVKSSVLGVIKSWKAFVTLMLLFMLVFFGVVLLASFVVAIVMAVMGPGSQMLINVIILFFAVTVAGIGLCAQYQAYTEVYKHGKEDDKNGTEIYAEI
ncbi:hypothetical protein MNBD_GAMMA02-1557 [hydrothermal vent metagenome]|uniref:Transmembrane protein n=1 Tax=hydrothermal vent metagenome TaxID=652676 RepID=A0A3B0VU68_9ZZZZ